MAPKTIEMCKGCQRHKGNKCQVISDPRDIFKRNGECWAWTDDPDWKAKVKEAVDQYRDGRCE